MAEELCIVCLGELRQLKEPPENVPPGGDDATDQQTRPKSALRDTQLDATNK